MLCWVEEATGNRILCCRISSVADKMPLKFLKGEGYQRLFVDQWSMEGTIASSSDTKNSNFGARQVRISCARKDVL